MAPEGTLAQRQVSYCGALAQPTHIKLEGRPIPGLCSVELMLSDDVPVSASARVKHHILQAKGMFQNCVTTVRNCFNNMLGRTIEKTACAHGFNKGPESPCLPALIAPNVPLIPSPNKSPYMLDSSPTSRILAAPFLPHLPPTATPLPTPAHSPCYAISLP